MTVLIVYDEQECKARVLRVGAEVPICELDGERADLMDLQPPDAPANLEDALQTLEMALFPETSGVES
jgi:hypothetical protein